MSAYYRRYWLQVSLIFLKSSLFSIGAAVCGVIGYAIFHVLMRRPPGHEMGVVVFGFGLIVFLGTCFFTLFTFRLCCRRPQNEPFRFSSHFEKYFTLEGDENSLPKRLASAGFSAASLHSQGGSILANKTQEFEAREYGEDEITRQARVIGIEARFCGRVWIGRIYARPVVWWAFYDGANLARLAVENTAAQLELSLQSDPPALLKNCARKTPG